MQEKVDFLGRLPIFEGLNEYERIDLARICDVFKVQDGNIVAYQRDVADKMFIVRKGRLEAFTVEQGVTTSKKLYTAGDWFHDIWLFLPGIHDATIRARGETEVWTIREDEFFAFLDDHPHVELDLSPEAWDELDHSNANKTTGDYTKLNMSVGEIVEYESRRTPLLLIFEMGVPVLLTIAAPILSIFLFRNIFEIDRDLITYSVAAFVTLFPLLFAIYRYLDWANDFLVITNKYLVHKDFNLRTFQGQIIKIPLDQVQSVRTIRPNWVETLLSLGSIRVTTASQKSGLVFDRISNPSQVEATLRKIGQRKQKINEGRVRKDVRSVLEQHFDVDRQMVEVKDDSAKGKASQSKRKAKRARRRGNRYETGDTVTYGRHWIVLFALIWWVILIMIATVAGFWFLYTQFEVAQIPFTLVAAVFVLLLESGLIYYFYENWANDVFQVTSDMVIDIDRGAFGLSESRKTAQLVNVQNVRTEQPNFWAALFNYGDVVIDTAGASAEIKFEDIANPGRVQTDIFDRREAVLRNRDVRSASSRRREFSYMIDEYQQLLEQDRIKRRTPKLDETVDEQEAK